MKLVYVCMISKAQPASVFKIEEDEDDLASPPTSTNHTSSDGNIVNTSEQQEPLLFETPDRIIGTMGFCGAFCVLFSCLCTCGICRKEFVETYRHHTLCGRWCPI